MEKNLNPTLKFWSQIKAFFICAIYIFYWRSVGVYWGRLEHEWWSGCSLQLDHRPNDAWPTNAQRHFWEVWGSKGCLADWSVWAFKGAGLIICSGIASVLLTSSDLKCLKLFKKYVVYFRCFFKYKYVYLEFKRRKKNPKIL